MNVGQLIEKLNKLDPKLMVVVRGYEGGVNEVVSLSECKIELDANKGTWYYGRHEVVVDEKTVTSTVDGIELNGDINN